MHAKRVCLITTGQPSSNPRLRKEADALSEAGYKVEAVGSFWSPWAEKADEKLLISRYWKYTQVGGMPEKQRLRYWRTRLRYGFARRVIRRNLGFVNNILANWAIARTIPELMEAAKSIRADLYIAHNLGALPVAAIASKKHQAKLGFDAEDFHSGDFMPGKINDGIIKLSEYVEMKYLPICDYITAASEPIACAYAQKYHINKPEVILNVFPLASYTPEDKKNQKETLSLYWFSQTIAENRGLEEVIYALGEVSSDVRLYLQGNIKEDYRRNLQELAAKSKLEKEKIIFLNPVFPDDLIDDLIRTASSFDVGLALERREPLNRDLCVTNKIFIYLLARLSVIATDTQGQRPIVESIGKAGWLYESQDIDALTKRIDLLASNKAQLEESKREAARYAQEKYNWDIEKKKFLDAIERILQ